MITEYGKPFTANGFGNKFKDWCRQADLHWPAPVLAIDAEPDRGPVLVTIEYRIDPEKSDAFLRAIRDLSQQRKRDGAYAWDVFEDAAEKGHFLETFMVVSWLEHLRQHQRVTNADRIAQDIVGQFDAAAEPKVTHFIAAALEPSRASFR